ncbi:MAG TPA: hypothetical protein VKA84_11420 [Gemmatimonadaceae bacterium]|nr:hypothetical protein [Gemmatimonadaceae bacterium]
MRLASLRRGVAAFLAFWVAATIGGPDALHSCPAHGTAGAHARHAPGHYHGAAPSPGPGHRHCTCLGDCCAAGPAAAPSVSGVRFPLPDSGGGGPVSSTDTAPRAAGARLLPFANGPPT